MQQELYSGHFGSYLECAASWSNDDGVYSIYTLSCAVIMSGGQANRARLSKGRKWKVILKLLLFFILDFVSDFSSSS